MSVLPIEKVTVIIHLCKNEIYKLQENIEEKIERRKIRNVTFQTNA
jgi:hypothetical protein